MEDGERHAGSVTRAEGTGRERAREDGAAEHRSAPLRWLDGVRANPAGRLTLKIVIGVLGGAMVIGGLIMVPFPGPGWLIVFGGLALLATEFAWAHRVLEFGKEVLGAWTRWLMRQNWPVRILFSAVTLALAAVIVWFMIRLTLGIDLVEKGRQIVGS